MRNQLGLLLRTEQGAVASSIQLFGVLAAGIIIAVLAVWGAVALIVEDSVAEPVKILDDSEVCITGMAMWPEIMAGPQTFVLCGTIVQKHYEVEGEARLQEGGGF